MSGVPGSRSCKPGCTLRGATQVADLVLGETVDLERSVRRGE
jgi:hypothetical protein